MEDESRLPSPLDPMVKGVPKKKAGQISSRVHDTADMVAAAL